MDEQQILVRIIESGLAQCSVILREDGGVLATALMAGLVGSVTHCLGMCGPFVISQVTARMEKLPVGKMSEFHRLTGAALLPYQAGRLCTYVLLGAMAGYFSDNVAALMRVWWLGPVLLLAAAAFFVAFGVLGLVPHISGLFPAWVGNGKSGAGRWWQGAISTLARRFLAAPFGWRGFVLGLMLGFIPCGLVYGALVLAAAAGGALAGGMVMAVFGLATVPMLFATGYAGQYATRRFKTLMTPVGRGLMVVNGIVLAVLAVMQMA